MSKESRQRAILVVLVAVFGIVIWSRLSDSGNGPRRSRAVRARAQALVEATPDVVALRVGDLEHEGAVYSPGRDPFSYGPAPQPERPPQPAEQPRRQPQRRRQQAPAQRAKPARPQPPEVDVTFLGSFGRQEDRIAVFLDGSDIINAKVGETVKDKFIVDAIGYESADLAFVGFPEAPNARLPAGGPGEAKPAGGRG